LLVQRRSNQEETTPRWHALQASCLPGARTGYGVFRRDSCPGEKLAGIPAGHPADFPRPARRAIGGPGGAARSCAQKQGQQQEHPTPALPCTQGRETTGTQRFASAVAVASGVQEARLLLRGPWAAVRRGRPSRAAGESMDGLAFSRGQARAWMPELRQRRSGCPMPARKARPRLTDLPGRMPGKRQPGWPSLLVTFLLATQEKSNSGAGRRSKPL